MSYWNEELPLIQDVRKWSPSTLIEKLKEKEYLYLDDDDIEILKKKKISGQSFLLLNKEDLEKFGLEFGPASAIAEIVKAINGDETAFDNVRLSELENENASLRAQLNTNVYGWCAYCCGVRGKLVDGLFINIIVAIFQVSMS